MGDFQGGFERFPEIFPHRREREKNAAKQIVRIDNQSIIHKNLHLLTIEPRRGPMLEKRGSRTHLKVKRTLKGIIFLCRCRFFHIPTKQVLLIFLSFRRVFTTEDYLDHIPALVNKSQNITRKHAHNNNSLLFIIRAK